MGALRLRGAPRPSGDGDRGARRGSALEAQLALDEDLVLDEVVLAAGVADAEVLAVEHELGGDGGGALRHGDGGREADLLLHAEVRLRPPSQIVTAIACFCTSSWAFLAFCAGAGAVSVILANF